MAGESHLAIYIGGGQVADMFINPYRLEIRNIPNYESWTGVYFTYVAHLKSFDGVQFSPVPDGTDRNKHFKPQGDVDNTDDDPIDLDKLEFEFPGNPSVMTFEGQKKPNFWLFSKFSQFINLLIGIRFSGIRAALVGWGIIVENFINTAIHFLSFGG